MARPRKDLPELRRLARAHGVQASYVDVFRRRRVASAETLAAILGALGVSAESDADVPRAWAEHHRRRWEQPLEPVMVAWDGSPAALEVRLPANGAEGPLTVDLALEGGETLGWRLDLGDLPVETTAEVGRSSYVTKRPVLEGEIPPGYHRLSLGQGRRHAEALLISAPRRVYGTPERDWGVFLPLYALRTRDDWGAGDFGGLASLLAWAADLGASMVGTLPLLAAFLGEPFEPSPYSPASRLFWNELYLDLAAIPEVAASARAASLLNAPGFRRELAELRVRELVDYRRVAELKRRVLEPAVEALLSEESPRRAALNEYAAANPGLADYARFRSETEHRRSPWQTWPGGAREGRLEPRDDRAYRYHLAVQWLAHEQLGGLRSAGHGAGLYLDLPLGVHPSGFDPWRERESFALSASGGAPADAAFPSGQVWGFPPMHPEGIRTTEYRYPIACLRQLLGHAQVLRVDHVMGLHRLFWIPQGGSATGGTYVRYPAEELYAILSIESHRARTAIVGEDLGTVPTYVTRSMARHGVRHSYVVEYELLGGELRRPLAASLATLGTHDMPPFAAFWEGLDIPQRVELGLLDRGSVSEEEAARRRMRQALAGTLRAAGVLRGRGLPEAGVVAAAALEYLGSSEAATVMVTLEDLWEERRAQNVPGTRDTHPNWRHRSCHTLEETMQMPDVAGMLRRVDHLRRDGKGGP